MDSKNNYHKNKVIENNQQYLSNTLNTPTQYVKKTNQYFGDMGFEIPEISFFTDASVKKNTVIAGYGISKETILVSFRKEISTNNNNLAELLAVKEVIHLAKMMNVHNLEIFTDCLPVIEHIRRFYLMQKSSEIFSSTLKQVSEELATFKSYRICWVARHRNVFADQLTQIKLQ